MKKGTHSHQADQRNAQVLISINGVLYPRAEAKVSVFDSGFLMGDGVWEGLRLHQGKIAFLDAHLQRLYQGAKALDIDIGKKPHDLRKELYRTIAANNMYDGVHIRLMVTRGMKTTPFQGASVNIGGATIVIVAEWKSPAPEVVQRGLRLFTVHVRRGRPDVQDPMWNSHSKLNCVSACIQAQKAGADEGLMLDPHGFVATCNSTHFFIVRQGELWTSSGDYCLHGITRGNVLHVAKKHGIKTCEKNFSLTQVYSADEAFCTGTYSGLIPVREVDGRTIGEGVPGPLTTQVREFYRQLIVADCAKEQPNQ